MVSLHEINTCEMYMHGLNLRQLTKGNLGLAFGYNITLVVFAFKFSLMLLTIKNKHSN